MSIIVNPTGLGVRNDGAGNGNYGRPRGARRHNGTDFLCTPGQIVYSPINGRVARLSLPYKSDESYLGVLIIGQRLDIKLWYFTPDPGLVGRSVQQGERVGIAQNIASKYGGGMTPHVHLQVSRVDPTLLMVG